MNQRPAHFVCMMILALAPGGCKRPHADMGAQDKYTTYQATDFFADGAVARMPVAGTVAHDASESPDIAAADAKIPFPVTMELVRAGEERFNIFCAACHGRLGNGEGMIVQRGFTRPPSFHVPRLRQAPDSHLYNVITNGYGAMFRFDDVVRPQQRWEIVAYIRILQAVDSLPNLSDQDRITLIARGDRPPPTTGVSP